MKLKGRTVIITGAAGGIGQAVATAFAADGITVNAVAPGPIASRMTDSFPPHLRNIIPAGRMGTADEVAEACLFLASESSGFITAEILDINGGMWGD